jgi:hypothetical protein
LAENAVTALFERTINDTRIFWAQRADGSFACHEWEWCCPEIPAVLSGLEAVVFVTREPSHVRLVSTELIVVALSADRLWGRHRVLRRAPRGVKATTWDDRLEVQI